MANANGCCYRIFYEEDGHKRSLTAYMRDVFVLASYLNAFVKTFPKKRVIYVSLVNDFGEHISKVAFFDEEMKNQKWVTTPEQRVLLAAKNAGLIVEI